MSLSSILAGLIIAFVYSWKMTLVILGFVPFLVAGGFLQMTMLQGAAGKNKEALEAAGKVNFMCCFSFLLVILITNLELNTV